MESKCDHHNIRASLLAAEPQIFVTDIQASISHYKRLGMHAVFTYGEPPFYAQVGRDGVRFNLRLVDSPLLDEARRNRETLLAATVTVDDVKRLFHEFQEEGIEFHQSLRKEPWGARTFIAKDPDGNLILFAGSL